MVDYCITVRAPSGPKFGDDPGKTTFLAVDDKRPDVG